jgi:hypothetical protein
MGVSPLVGRFDWHRFGHRQPPTWPASGSSKSNKRLITIEFIEKKLKTIKKIKN